MSPDRSASLRVWTVACLLGCAWVGAWEAPCEAVPVRVTGTGFVTDRGHPMNPTDVRTHEFTARVTFDPVPGEAVVTFDFAPPDSQGAGPNERYRYHVRRGRVFQVDEKGAEIVPRPVGDVPPSVVAAIHPALVAVALRERPECVRRDAGVLLFAWNDELWTVNVDSTSSQDRVTELRYDYASGTDGDQTMEVRYEGWPAGPAVSSPGRVVIRSPGRELMKVDFTATEPVDSIGIAAGARDRDRELIAGTEEMAPREIAPHLFAIDLRSVNTRVFVAEFRDHLMVFEGAFNSRNADAIAARVGERFQKPVRYFAFSHLHGQYVAGTRSWVHQGATVLVPPTTAPLIESMVQQGRRLRPDALAAEPRPLRMKVVPRQWRTKDQVNAAEIYNVESGHTDEYLIVYFPRQKVLLTGDLLFYRPGKPLSERSLKLCESVRKLGLDVETYVATWPLDGYGTKNMVTRDEMHAACPR